MNSPRAWLACLLLLPALLPASDKAPTEAQTVTELRRYLRGVHFGESFQSGIRKVNDSRGSSTPFLDRLLAARPEELEATIAPAFARHVTLQEARAMADFVESPLGRKAIQEGIEAVNDPGNPVELSPDEKRELAEFDASPVGRKVTFFNSDAGLRQEYFALLKARYDP